jgi:hypothetical protein
MNHIFTVTDADPSLLIKEEFYGGVKTTQRILKEYIDNNEHWPKQHYTQLDSEEAPGIKDIKWVELYSKPGKFVPPEKKLLWKYYNTDPGKVRVKNVRNQSKESKLQRKMRTTTEDKENTHTAN